MPAVHDVPTNARIVVSPFLPAPFSLILSGRVLASYTSPGPSTCGSLLPTAPLGVKAGEHLPEWNPARPHAGLVLGLPAQRDGTRMSAAAWYCVARGHKQGARAVLSLLPSTPRCKPGSPRPACSYRRRSDLSYCGAPSASPSGKTPSANRRMAFCASSRLPWYSLRSSTSSASGM